MKKLSLIFLLTLGTSAASFAMGKYTSVVLVDSYDGYPRNPTMAQVQAACEAQSNNDPCQEGVEPDSRVGPAFLVSWSSQPLDVQKRMKILGETFSGTQRDYRCVQQNCIRDWDPVNHKPYMRLAGPWPWAYITHIITRPERLNEETISCEPRKSGASEIGIATQSLSETIPLRGLPFDLVYSTKLQVGKGAKYQIVIPLPADDTGYGYAKVMAKITDANGTVLDSVTQALPTSTVYTYTWNGLDSLGNPALATRKVFVSISFLDAFDGEHLYDSYSVNVGGLKASLFGLADWLPSNFVFYDQVAKAIYFADGESQEVTATDLSGTGWRVAVNDGGQVYDFNANGTLNKIRTGVSGSKLWEYYYDGSGRIDAIEDGFGNQVTFQRDISGNLASVTGAYGQVSTTTVDGNGRLQDLTTPGSNVYAMTYDVTLGLLATFTKPGGAVSTFSYDADGYLTKDEHSGGAFWELVASMGEGTRTVTMTSAGGRIRTATEAKKYLTEVLPDGTMRTQNSQGSVSVMNDRGANYQIKYVGDARFGSAVRRMSSVTGAENNVPRRIDFSYGATLSTPSDPFSATAITESAMISGISATKAYSSSTNTWTMTSPAGYISTVKIDANDRPIETKQGGLTKVEYAYTNENLTQVKQGSRTVDFGYDPSTGYLDTITNALTEVTSFGYDGDGFLTTITRPDLSTVLFGRGPTGQVTSVTTPASILHTFNFNPKELVSDYVSPTISGSPGGTTTYSYDDDGLLTNILKPSGKNIAFGYSTEKGTLNHILAPEGYTYYSYDPATALPSSAWGPNDVEVTRQYAGRVVSNEKVMVHSTGAVVSEYRRAFHPITATVSSDTVVVGAATSAINYTRDYDGRVTKAGDMTLTYDSNGQLSGSSMGVVTDVYTYDADGLIATYAAKVSGVTKYSYSITRDAIGRISSKTEQFAGVTSVFSYSYDNLGRLTTVLKNSNPWISVGYDANGNRTSITKSGTTKTATFDEHDRLIANTAYNFAYDTDGNLTNRTDVGSGASYDYMYDSFGRLVSGSVTSGAPVLNHSREYDPFGRLLSLTSAGVPFRRLVYSPEGKVVAGINLTNGQIGKRFIYASKENIPDYYVDYGAGYKVRIISDERGSPRLIWKTSDGTALGRNEFDPFGIPDVNLMNNLLPFGFAGGIWDVDAKMVRFGARDYLPIDGVWTTKDPIGFAGGDTNLYGYVMNDPVNHFDPSGTGPAAGLICRLVLPDVADAASRTAFSISDEVQRKSDDKTCSADIAEESKRQAINTAVAVGTKTAVTAIGTYFVCPGLAAEPLIP